MRLAKSRTAMTSLRSTYISQCPLFDPASVPSDQHTLRVNHPKQVLHEVVGLLPVSGAGKCWRVFSAVCRFPAWWTHLQGSKCLLAYLMLYVFRATA